MVFSDAEALKTFSHTRCSTFWGAVHYAFRVIRQTVMLIECV